MRLFAWSKSILPLFLVVVMVLASVLPVAAAGKKWTSVAEGDILIMDTITKISESVYEHEVITNNSAGNDQKIDYLVEIEPSDSVKVVAGYGKDNADSWSLTTTTKQAAAYEKNHAGETVVAGINADFFNMGTGEPLGALVMEGQVKHSSNGRFYFGITKDGKPIISNNPDLSNLQSAVGGDALLLNNGEIALDSSAYGDMDYSRTAIGYKADGTIVTFVTYGNRAPVSCGRNYYEIAQMLKNAGCIYGLALDGGGSSTLISRPEGTTGLQLRNHPVDGAEREVSSSLLIVSTAEATGVFSHAQLTPNNEVYTPGSQIQFEANGVDTAGMAMDLPEGTTWAVAENSKDLGTIDAATGLFTASDKTGEVTVNLMKDGNVVGETTIEIVIPDSIYFATEEVSLGFEEESDLGIVVRSKGRDVNYKDGDIVWTIDNVEAGAFTGNIFKSSDGNSVTTTATAKSAHDESVSGSITVIVGKLPTIVWDFEDVTLEDGTTVSGKDYYVGTTENPGILSTSNYGRGGKQSIEVVTIDDDEPVRFGANSLKLNYDFTQCGEVTEGACVGTTAGMTIPGVPTGIGVWVYAPEGVGIDTWEKQGDQAGFWLRGYVKDGSGANVPYDFTLEPKVITPESGTQPGIYWEGWKYLEADLTHLQAPFSIQPGMTFRLMYVFGTQMGTKTANSIYFDNLQFVYGTNVDDIDNPIIDSITVNGKELAEGAVIDTDKINIDSIFHDTQNKYTSGIDDATVRMYIDGINVVGNDKYEYAYADSMTHIYNLKLKDGSHAVTVTIRDKFGNETSETRNFVVDTDNQIEETTVKVVAANDAILGGTVELQIKASDATVKESTTTFKLGNQFKDYEVVYSDNYDGTTTYSKMNKTITVSAARKEGAAEADNNVIATLKVKIPSNLLEGDVFSYAVKSGEFETTSGVYETYSAKEIKIPVKAGFTVSAKPIILGGADGVIEVKDAEGNAAKDVTIYLVDGDTAVGTTDENGQLVTKQFNEVAGEYKVYAKDAEGRLSFQYKVYSYAHQGDATGVPHNIRFNTVDNAKTQKNITWMSNPLVDGKQVIKYAVAGSEDWTTVEANASQEEFQYNGFDVVDVNSVTLKNLTAGTTYNYKVGTGEAMSEVKSFTTDKAGRTDTKFFILGDIQDPDKTNLQTIVDKLNDEEYNFGIQIGDAIDQANDYDDWAGIGEIVGEKMLGDIDMISVMGNHEYYGDADASIASAIYNNDVTEAGSYYSVEYGNIYMAVINFCDNTNQIKEAANWLKKDAANSDAVWKVLLTHQPAYFTNSVGGNDPVYEYLPDACEEAGISVVFSGHDHSFARTKALLNDKEDEENGIVYYVTGAIGSKRYPASTQDKFDYNAIFAYGPNGDFDATYLTAESTEDEMTVKMYVLGNDEPVNVYTIKSECSKNDHKLIYNRSKNEVKCKICGHVIESYTGDVKDANGKEYYLLSGKRQTGWVTVGEEIRYYDSKGVREKVTQKVKPSTCLIDGHCVHTSESGATFHEKFNDAGGHDYVETDGAFICSACGWRRFEVSECSPKLSYTKTTYNGNTKTPKVTLKNPLTGETLRSVADEEGVRDYRIAYKNNKKIGTATVTLTAVKYAAYVNKNDWRGNYKGTTTLTFDILPGAPKNAFYTTSGTTALLRWNAGKYVERYVIYKSTDGETWERVASTKNLSYTVKNLKKNVDYQFRVATSATGLDANGKSKSFEAYTDVHNLKPVVEVSYSSKGKPVLKWNDLYNTKYTVYRATSKNGKYSKLGTTSGGQYTNSSASAGRTYYYKVVAKRGTASRTSNICEATVRCSAPTITVKRQTTTGKPVVTWKKISGAVKYQVYRSFTGKNNSYEMIGTVKGTSYTDKAALADQTCYYRVVAVDKKDQTSQNSKSAKIVCTVAIPDAKGSYRKEDGKPVVTWEKVEGAAKYQVYRSTTGKTGSYTRMSTTTKTEYVNTSAVEGKTYYYKVRALTEAGNSGSFTDNVKIRCMGAKPELKVTNSEKTGNPRLSWNKVKGAVKYQVYRSTSGKTGTFTRISVTKNTSLTNSSVVKGKTYYYRVRPVFSSGSVGQFSDLVEGSVLTYNADTSVEAVEDVEAVEAVEDVTVEDTAE